MSPLELIESRMEFAGDEDRALWSCALRFEVVVAGLPLILVGGLRSISGDRMVEDCSGRLAELEKASL